MTTQKNQKETPAASKSPTDGPKLLLAKGRQSKRQKITEAKSEFPHFDDGDTVITLGTDKTEDLLLHRVELQRMSGYFANFPETEWPKRFELTAGEEDAQLKPASENSQASNQPGSNFDVRIDSQVHELLFRALYHQSISFLSTTINPGQLLLRLTSLAQVYDCLSHVKDQLIAEIYTGDCFGVEMIVGQPDIFLVIANKLQNKRLFREALQHVIGQTLKCNEDFALLNDGLLEIVNKYAEGVVSRVKGACRALYGLGTLEVWSDLAAHFVFQKFLLQRIAAKRVASGEMFATFRYLRRLTSGSELIEALELEWLLNSAAIVPSGVRDAIECIEQQRRQDNDSESALESLSSIEELEIGPDRIKAALKKLIAVAQAKIEPLMATGPEMGYFTCVDKVDIYPWEKIANETLEAE